MILDSTTKILQLIATAACDVTVCGEENPKQNQTGIVLDTSFSQETAATASTQKICDGPTTALTVRRIGRISIKNGASANTLTLQMYNSSGTVTTVFDYAVLAANETYEFTYADGGKTKDANGAEKYSISGIALASGKTLTVSNSLTFAGTDGTTMTFPTTSATIARTDAANTFTGTQTFSSQPILSSLTGSLPVFTDASKGLISGSQTGTGTKVVVDTSPTIVTPVINSAAHVGGTWVADATWTLPALTLGGTVSGGGNQINNVVIGTVTPLAAYFTTGRFSTSVALINGEEKLSVDSSTGGAAVGIRNDSATASTVGIWNTATSGNNLWFDLVTESTYTHRGSIYYDRTANAIGLTNTAITGTLSTTGNVGIGGITSPTAALHLPASTAAANTASLKITAGTVATTPVSGNIESDGTHLYWTNSSNTRIQLDN